MNGRKNICKQSLTALQLLCKFGLHNTQKELKNRWLNCNEEANMSPILNRYIMNSNKNTTAVPHLSTTVDKESDNIQFVEV